MPPPRDAHFPADRIGFAVGDIHGRADLLKRMLERLEGEARGSAGNVVVFLGDYIDRGPDTAEVIDLLLSARLPGFERHFLTGNHEQALIWFLDNPVAGRAWLQHGGLDTLASYGVRPLPGPGADEHQLRAAAQNFADLLPPAHLAFFRSLERYVTLGDYAFVHAGMSPSVALDDQTDADLFWIRDAFLNDRRALSHVVVHGHTPAPGPFRDHRRIGVDTGAYVSGQLTAARFYGPHVDFITITSRGGALGEPR